MNGLFGTPGLSYPEGSQEEQARDHNLYKHETVYGLRIRPACFLAGVVMQGRTDIFHNGNLQEALQRNLNQSESAVENEDEAERNEQKRVGPKGKDRKEQNRRRPSSKRSAGS